MDKKELAYAKQTIINVKDWDLFQAVIRFLAQTVRPPQPTAELINKSKYKTSH